MVESSIVRSSQRESAEKIWNISAYVDLTRDFIAPRADIFELLEQRRTRRSFKEIDRQVLSSILWYSLRHTGFFPGAPDRVTTPIPTFGGLASVRTLIIEPNLEGWIYDPQLHRAGFIDCKSEIKSSVRNEANNFFNIDRGSLLIFAASREFVTSFYDEPNHLALREAGGLIATFALLAEAFFCSFCPLGTLGESWLSAVLNTNEEIVIPCGAAVIGGR